MDDVRMPMIPEHRVESRVQILAEKKNYNHKMMNIPHMWRDARGQDIKLAILDTGVPDHLDLEPAAGHTSFIPDYSTDKNGHATHIAGIAAAIADNDMGVAGVAPDVMPYYAAVLDHSGSGSVRGIVSAIHWAVEEGVDVINMSLGLSYSNGRDQLLEAACDYAANHGVAIFAAAGNNAGAINQPAVYDSVISVAAVNSLAGHADFSSSGPELDFAAGGVRVYSTYLDNSYARLSGTSMACPALAGVGCLILSKHKQHGPALSPDELKEHIKKIAYDVGQDGFDELYGHGIPVFGKSGDYVPSIPGAKKDRAPEERGDPQANCAYWKIFSNTMAAAENALKPAGATTEDALKAGIKEASKSIRATNRALELNGI